LTESLYNDFWHTFCDIYIEKSKARIWKDKSTGEYQSTPESRKAAQATLYYTLKSFLKMLHPFIPFITEEIWQHLVENAEYDEVLMYA
jgi:valyl-tRNA synthetase